jgi:hypothetical protein
MEKAGEICLNSDTILTQNYAILRANQKNIEEPHFEGAGTLKMRTPPDFSER